VGVVRAKPLTGATTLSAAGPRTQYKRCCTVTCRAASFQHEPRCHGINHFVFKLRTHPLDYSDVGRVGRYWLENEHFRRRWCIFIELDSLRPSVRPSQGDLMREPVGWLVGSEVLVTLPALTHSWTSDTHFTASQRRAFINACVCCSVCRPPLPIHPNRWKWKYFALR